MKIAFMVSSFPELSETFILNKITGLLDRGHEVDIFADSDRDDPKVHPDVEKYSLLDRTYYREIPTNKFRRVLKAIPLIIANFHKNPIGILKTLNIFRYGKRSFSLQLLYNALPFLNKNK